MTSVRELPVERVREAVRRLCVETACLLPDDVTAALRRARDREDSAPARRVLDQLLRNAESARGEMLPLCQDSGLPLLFLEIGQDVHLVGGTLQDAIRDGVAAALEEGYLRGSLLRWPLAPDGGEGPPLPAVYTEIVPGDRLRLRLMARGAGGEGAGCLLLLPGHADRAQVARAVVQVVQERGRAACPPIIVGVGIGGTAEYAMLLARRALLRRVGEPHPWPEAASLEGELLERVNALGIGPLGVGGRTTALAVHVELHPSHASLLPVAVALQCHSARLRELVL